MSRTYRHRPVGFTNVPVWEMEKQTGDSAIIQRKIIRKSNQRLWKLELAQALNEMEQDNAGTQ